MRPHLDIYIDLGIAMLKTSVMVERYERQWREYIGLYWRLFKWDGYIRLYSPYRP